MNPEENNEFYKSLRERIKQLRMYDGILDDSYDDDEEPDVFIGDGWDCRLSYDLNDDDLTDL